MAKYVVEKGLTPSVENNWVTFGGSAISLKAGSANVHVTKTGEMYTIAVDEGVPAPDLPARDQIKVLQGTANFNDAPPITLTAAKAAIDINTAKVGVTPAQATAIEANSAKTDIPVGGTTGQALVKKTNADGDVEWSDATGGIADVVAGSANVHVAKAAGVATISVDEGEPAPDVPARDQIKAVQGTTNWNDPVPINLTAAKAAIEANSAKTDIPVGGTTGQALVKKTNADGDVEWSDTGGGGSDIPARDQIKSIQGTANWNDPVPVDLTAAKTAMDLNTAKVAVPIGGTTGQALIKKTDGDGDVEWGPNGGDDAFGYGCITVMSGGTFVEADKHNDAVEFIGIPINIIAISGNNEVGNKSITFTVNIPELVKHIDAERLKQAKSK